ncbi:hypothetical protein AB0B97_29810 [Micromonospora sp. NPDC049004]|uniref:hypothetical protein n=1 Tax=Micromonospora sp. NPDC049004 TaxID=3154348 RepID=UPI0033C38C1F
MDVQEAQHGLALASVHAFPYTWSPRIDQAVTELSRAHRALRAAIQSSNTAARRRKAEQQAASEVQW